MRPTRLDVHGSPPAVLRGRRGCRGPAVRVRHSGSRLTPVTPSSWANRRCSASWLLSMRFTTGVAQAFRPACTRTAFSEAGLKACTTPESRPQPDVLAISRGTRRSTRSRIVAAMRALLCSGSDSAPSGPTIVTALVVDVESRIRARDVVGDDEIDVLPLALGGGARHDVFRFGRESDQQRSASASRSGAGPDRRGCRASSSARASAYRRPSTLSATRAARGV